MINHPFIGDLSAKTAQELQETISKLTKNMGFMGRTGRHAMVNQMQMVLQAYRDEFNRRQEREWNEKYGNNKNFTNKIDIG